MVSLFSAGALATVSLATLLIFVCAFVESHRPRRYGSIDFLAATTWVFALVFGVVPIMMLFLWDTETIPTQWWFSAQLPPAAGAYAYAVLIALLAYLALVSGVALGFRDKIRSRPEPPATYLLWIGLACSVFGAGCLLLYAMDIGGLQFMLETIMDYRTQQEPVYSSLGFLKTISPIATAGAFLVFAAAQVRRGKVLSWVAFIISLLLASLTLLVNAGRLMVLQFLLAFPLFYVLRSRGRLTIPIGVAATVIFGGFVAFGHGMFDLFRGGERIEAQFAESSRDPTGAVVKLAMEFSWPIEGLAMTTREVGAEGSEFRGVSDLYLGPAYLVPKRLLNVELPDTVSMKVADMMRAPIPADIVTTGYWSSGPLGVVLIALGFGWLIGRFESWFPADAGPVVLVLRAAWITYLCSRVMYGNPHHTVITALPLVAASVLVFGYGWLRQRPALPVNT